MAPFLIVPFPLINARALLLLNSASKNCTKILVENNTNQLIIIENKKS